MNWYLVVGLIGTPLAVWHMKWVYWPNRRNYMVREDQIFTTPRVVNRAFIRATPCVWALCVAALLFLGVARISPTGPVTGAVLAFFLALLVLLLVQMLFNRPKRIVHPRYRDDPGLVEDLRTMWRHRHGTE